MKIWLKIFVLLTFGLRAAPSLPDDQLLVIFGSSGYVLYKALDFANDHGFRYIQILSYEFKAFHHEIKGTFQGERNFGGRYFELKDENSSMAILCYDEPPKDRYYIDLEKYRSLLETLEEEK
jgi:hypothetical protein